MSAGARFTIGLDFGTNSVRALVVDVRTGAEAGTHVFDYTSGRHGVLLDPTDPLLARQSPMDHLAGLEASIRGALEHAAATDGFSPDRVIGIGVDTTGSTPIPVDADGRPLGLRASFSDRLDAQAWLWKDHTGHAEAQAITEIASRVRPEYLAKCGGTYSSEWFWSKIWHCLAVAPDVFETAYTWVEHADWIPALLTGTEHPDRIVRGVCAAGHKALYNESWGGYPDDEFLAELDPELVRIGATLRRATATVASPAGGLTAEWARRLGLREGIPVAVGAFDAHLGGVGSGIGPGTLVKNIGTSTCDMMVAPLAQDLPDVPGLCGIVPESILPGQFGLEAGQSAVGDIFAWFVDVVRPEGGSHTELTAQAERLRPGESGLLALDWHNGNRTVLVDQRLSGLIMGLSLHSTPAEIYRALIEATAFGARVIMERFVEYGIAVERIVNCGGISARNPLAMQIYADVMNRTILIARSDQTAALGASMAAAVVAGSDAGGHDDFAAAIQAMTGVRDLRFEPNPEAVEVYERLYALYRRIHDSFGIDGHTEPLADVMKTLLDLRDEARRS